MISNRMTRYAGLPERVSSWLFASNRTELHLALEGPKDGEQPTEGARLLHVHDLNPQRPCAPA
jgi:hypothetical protein